MITPTAVDSLFADWLRARAQGLPTDGDLVAFIAALPTESQRRAARLYARGFLRGYDFCAPIERGRVAADLLDLERRLADLAARVRGILDRIPPESTS